MSIEKKKLKDNGKLQTMNRKHLFVCHP